MSVQMKLRNPHRASDVARGFLALVGVIALVVGVPIALVTWVGSPLPADVPSVSEVTTALRDTYIPDEFLVKALALVCWLVWIELAASLLVEAVAYARGRRAGAVPLAGGLQRGAARLVATVALLGALVATRGTPDPAARTSQPLIPAGQPVASLVVDDPEARREDKVALAAAAAPTYQVQRRDTLWDIAERHLGDPFRWQEIFQLNQGRPQADGTCLTDPDLIYTGWWLELPGDAIGLPTTEPVATPAAPVAPDKPEPPTQTAPDRSSVVVEGGMVLIDDGGGGGNDVLLVAESTPAGTATDFGGMVLLPAEQTDGGAVPDGPAILAGPPGRDERDRDSHDDEMASRPEGPRGAPQRPADDD
jgi:hypothetical protein